MKGTYKFKEQWGATPVPLHWEYVMVEGSTMPEITAGNSRFQLMVEGWKKLPLPLATALRSVDRAGHPRPGVAARGPHLA